MASIDMFQAMRMRKRELPSNFFELMQGPSPYQFFTPYELGYLKDVVLGGKNEAKLNLMSALMKSKGFSRIGAGTNRVVYRYLDDPNFVLKVALDRVGLQDNLLEFKNQQILKPFVAKMFSATEDGLVATAERVLPITSKEEFMEIIDEVFHVIVAIIGQYVMEDIGKGFFRNWAIRPSFGPVLCDYPYLYKVDESKLFCTKVDPVTGERCYGQIDYDDAFNYLKCNVCGKRYLAIELEDKSSDNKTITSRFGGKYPMKLQITMGDGTVYTTGRSSKTTIKPKKQYVKPGAIKINITGLNPEETKAPVTETIPTECNNTTKIIRVSDHISVEDKVIVTPTEIPEKKPVEEKVEEPAPEQEVVNPLVEEETDTEVTVPEEEVQEPKYPTMNKSGGMLKVNSGFIKPSNMNSEY